MIPTLVVAAVGLAMAPWDEVVKVVLLVAVVAWVLVAVVTVVVATGRAGGGAAGAAMGAAGAETNGGLKLGALMAPWGRLGGSCELAPCSMYWK